MADKRIQLTLKQITTANGELFGLDEGGRVWVYKAANDDRKALWVQLTAFALMWVPDDD